MNFEMQFQRFGHRVGDGLDAVRAEADRAGAADAFQMLDQQLHFVAVVAVTKEQGADAAERFGHRETSEPALPTFRKISPGMPSRSLIVI